MSLSSTLTMDATFSRHPWTPDPCRHTDLYAGRQHAREARILPLCRSPTAVFSSLPGRHLSQRLDTSTLEPAKTKARRMLQAHFRRLKRYQSSTPVPGQRPNPRKPKAYGQQKSPAFVDNAGLLLGAPWGIRTLDLLIRSGLKLKICQR